MKLYVSGRRRRLYRESDGQGSVRIDYINVGDVFIIIDTDSQYDDYVLSITSKGIGWMWFYEVEDNAVSVGCGH